MSVRFRKILAILLLILGVQFWLMLQHGYWGRNRHVIALAAIFVISVIPPISSRIARVLDATRHPSPRTRCIIGLAIALLASIYMYSTAVRQERQFALHIHDEFSYMIQIRMLLTGRLWMPAHPVGEFFESFYLLH